MNELLQLQKNFLKFFTSKHNIKDDFLSYDQVNEKTNKSLCFQKESLKVYADIFNTYVYICFNKDGRYVRYSLNEKRYTIKCSIRMNDDSDFFLLHGIQKKYNKNKWFWKDILLI